MLISNLIRFIIKKIAFGQYFSLLNNIHLKIASLKCMLDFFSKAVAVHSGIAFYVKSSIESDL